MAAAKGKVKKAGTRKRREKKNIERGAAHIRSSFNYLFISLIIFWYNGKLVSPFTL